MKTSAAYNDQVELMRKCNLFYEHDGSKYLISQIIVRKIGEDTVYRLYGSSVTDADSGSHYQDVPGSYNLKVQRLIQKRDIFRYLMFIAAPILTLITLYVWYRILNGRDSLIYYGLAIAGTILSVFFWQVIRDNG